MNINIPIDINMNIDIHIIINMNIEYYMNSNLLSIIYSLLGIALATDPFLGPCRVWLR